MPFITGYFIKRLRREGIKSLAVPLLVFTLVILINVLGGIKEWLDAQYNYTLDNHIIIAEISDLSGSNTDGLQIGMDFIDLFTNPGAALSLYDFTDNLMLQSYLNAEITDSLTNITLIGITDASADSVIISQANTVINFFDGYDKNIFSTNEAVCLVSEGLLALTAGGSINIEVNDKLPDEIHYILDPELNPGIVYDEARGWYFRYYENEDGDWVMEDLVEPDVWEFIPVTVEGATIHLKMELTVIGSVSGTENNTIYLPFLTLNAFTGESDDVPIFTESLSMTVANNRELSDFKRLASMSFSRVRPIQSTLPFAMMVYDSTFYEAIEPLMQNTILVDIAMPVVFAISVCVGFFTSTLLTRQRRSEFAVMRSVGIHKKNIFAGALCEQFLLSAAGAVIGCALIVITWGYLSFIHPAVILGCYMLGAVLPAKKAASANVLEIIREKE